MATTRNTQYEDHPFQPAPIADTDNSPKQRANASHHRPWRHGDVDRRRVSRGPTYQGERRASH